MPLRRLSEWYWQCQPKGGTAPEQTPVPTHTGRRLLAAQPPRSSHDARSPAPAPAAAATLLLPPPGSEYGQCGGTGQTCPLAERALCTDAAYLQCQSLSDTCIRVNQYFWQARMRASPLQVFADSGKVPTSLH